ncbi:MAG: lipocalin family protein [Candidatus Cloacimonetes bacterium]|nr:lipocalin family protein [Candidatus Cloacimonadota bacterium]
MKCQKFLSFTVFLCLMLTIVSCGSKDVKTLLIGEWVGEMSDEPGFSMKFKFNFQNDGSGMFTREYSYEGETESYPQPLTWSLNNDFSLVITVGGDPETFTIVEISNSLLNLEQDGETLSFMKQGSQSGKSGGVVRNTGTSQTRRSVVEDLGVVGEVEATITKTVSNDGIHWNNMVNDLRNSARQEASRDATGTLVTKGFEQYGQGYYNVRNIEIHHLRDLPIRRGSYPFQYNERHSYEFKVTGQLYKQNIIAPKELPITQERGTINMSIDPGYRRIMVSSDDDARNLFFDEMMREAIGKYSNALDVINIKLSGNNITGQILINITLPLNGSVNKALENLRKHIPQDAKVSIGDISTPIRKLKNNVNKEIESYFKDRDFKFVRSRSDFRITGRIEGEGENRKLHLQLINTKTGNIVDSTTVPI